MHLWIMKLDRRLSLLFRTAIVAMVLLVSVRIVSMDMRGVSDASFQPSAKKGSSKENYEHVNIVHKKNTHSIIPTQYECLQSDEEVDDLISNAKQVIIVMPAKAAGTSMKDFTRQCMNREFVVGNFLNDKKKVKDELIMGEPLSIPKIITSHIYKDEPLQRLIEHLPISSLLIYMHREESDRVSSAIKHIYTKDAVRKKNCDISYNETNNTCIVGEETLVSSIEAKTMEIHYGETQILTCDTYYAIEDNAPNMIYVHYKQADKLQRVLAKYHCPNMLEKGTLKENTAKDKIIETKVRLNSNDTQDVDLSIWVEAKAQMLQFALGLRGGQSC